MVSYEDTFVITTALPKNGNCFSPNKIEGVTFRATLRDFSAFIKWSSRQNLFSQLQWVNINLGLFSMSITIQRRCTV